MNTMTKLLIYPKIITANKQGSLESENNFYNKFIKNIDDSKTSISITYTELLDLKQYLTLEFGLMQKSNKYDIKEIYIYTENPLQVTEIFNLIKSTFNLANIQCLIYCNVPITSNISKKDFNETINTNEIYCKKGLFIYTEETLKINNLVSLLEYPLYKIQLEKYATDVDLEALLKLTLSKGLLENCHKLNIFIYPSSYSNIITKEYIDTVEKTLKKHSYINFEIFFNI